MATGPRQELEQVQQFPESLPDRKYRGERGKHSLQQFPYPPSRSIGVPDPDAPLPYASGRWRRPRSVAPSNRSHGEESSRHHGCALSLLLHERPKPPPRRRDAPPPRLSPSNFQLPMSSVWPPSTSLPKESSREARNRAARGHLPRGRPPLAAVDPAVPGLLSFHASSSTAAKTAEAPAPTKTFAQRAGDALAAAVCRSGELTKNATMAVSRSGELTKNATMAAVRDAAAANITTKATAADAMAAVREAAANAVHHEGSPDAGWVGARRPRGGGGAGVGQRWRRC